MYTKVAIVSALGGLAAPAPAPRSNSNPDVFTGVSIHSGSTVQAIGISASGSHFYLNKPTAAYCPSGVQGLDCSKFRNNTAFAYNLSTSGLGMSVAVPGGQQVYVDCEGALSYTIPHSAAIPEGSQTTGFVYTAQNGENSLGRLTFEGKDFSACPSGEGNVYQIFAAAVNPEAQSGCTSIAFGTMAYSGASAWEYS